MMKQETHAAVLGGGTMGSDIAAIFAAGGWVTHIVEPDPGTRATLDPRLKTALETLKSKDALGHFNILTDVDEVPWKSVAFVVECVPEDLAIKRAVFRQLESLSKPDIPLTSNSSSFPISQIGEGLATLSRMVGLHFFMPAHLVPLVEVIRCKKTNPEIAGHIERIMWKLGKRPVQVKRDIPGFLANRLQHALMREVLYLVEKGIASAEDVDAAVRYGFGFRFMAAGPLLQKDLSGVDIHCSAAGGIYPDLCNALRPSPYMTEMVAAGHTGVKTKKGFYDWTDEKINNVKSRYEKNLLSALDIVSIDHD